MRWLAAGLTDIGQRRSHNEDSIGVREDIGLFVVADGMGGHAAGEVASALAVVTVETAAREILQEEPEVGVASALERAVQHANLAIYRSSGENDGGKDMGTTIAAVWIRGDRVGVAHVGDSRLYRLRNGAFEPLTEDHSLVVDQYKLGLISRDELETSPMRHVLTRALGQQESVAVSVNEFVSEGADRLLLCSDGLTTMVSDAAIEMAMKQARQPGELCRNLVNLANHNGGEDNISVISIFGYERRLEYTVQKMMRAFRGEPLC